ncbi:uridine phosphorylase [Atopobacter sp. AH10]|uniref:nucleoside phosphorylase n=1 Tax=Atopobacter sp. AH10 TaxID=2315861 RepID=UPI000EF1D195|nr:nucleoside phosphorylase [Atopobacter sp. AH10]RLK63522.1 uridine phosphorylase [Atopobacter sp. AH10]
MEQTLYMKLTENNIAPYAILSGDPGRVELLKQWLDDIEEISINREFVTYRGNYKGVPILLSSTGIGGPSAAIAIEEMHTAGVQVAVRLGTVMSINDHLGYYYVPRASYRKDGTSDSYIDPSYPAVADPDLVRLMSESVIENGRSLDNGIIYSTQAYYRDMKESKLTRAMNTSISTCISKLKKLNISGMDMETSTLLTLGNLMGVKTCSVTLATVTENCSSSLEDKERLQEEKLLGKIVLEGLAKLDKEMNSNDRMSTK